MHGGMPYPSGKQQLGRQQGHQLASAMSGTDPHYGEGDPRQQDLPDPHPAEAGARHRLPDGGLPDIRPAVAHQSPLQQIQRQGREGADQQQRAQQRIEAQHQYASQRHRRPPGAIQHAAKSQHQGDKVPKAQSNVEPGQNRLLHAKGVLPFGFMAIH